MIHIQRDQLDDAGKAIRPNDDWFTRAAAATTEAVAEGKKHDPKKSIYADTEVRKALEKLFHGKCAYCEFPIPDDWDVDHFRPKGRVAKRDHPGYFWLVYEWTNLYPSCKPCNQCRKDPPMWDDPSELPSGGKVDQFPLQDEDTRAMSPADDIDTEHTLLINPCIDDPEDYLGYDPTGQILSLRRKRRGKATIEVFHLRRRRLKPERKKVIQQSLGMLKLLLSADLSAAARRDLEGLLDRMRAGDYQFAGVARYVAKHPEDFGL